MTFRQPEEADACIAAVHRRWFDGRTLEAEAWDGRTKYVIQESQEEMEKRLNKWHSFIEEDSNSVPAEGKGESEGQSQGTGTKTPSVNAPDTASDSSKTKSSVAVEDNVVHDVKNSSDDSAGV